MPSDNEPQTEAKEASGGEEKEKESEPEQKEQNGQNEQKAEQQQEEGKVGASAPAIAIVVDADAEGDLGKKEPDTILIENTPKKARPVAGLFSRALKAANTSAQAQGSHPKKAAATTAEAPSVRITPRKDTNGRPTQSRLGALKTADLGRNLLLAARLGTGEAASRRPAAPRIPQKTPLLTPRKGAAPTRSGKVRLSAGPGKVEEVDDDDDEDEDRPRSPEEEEDEDEDEGDSSPPGKRPLRASLRPSKEAIQAARERPRPLLKAAPGKGPQDESQRNRNLMGNLMGHLTGARQPRQGNAARTRRKVTLVGAKSVKKPKLSSAVDVAREKGTVKKTILKKASERSPEAGKKVELKKRPPVDQEKLAKIKKLEKHFKAMKKFIRTQASPHIFYIPAKPLPATDTLLKETAELLDAKIEALKTNGEVDSSDEIESSEGEEEGGDAKKGEASGAEDEYEYEYEEEEEEEEEQTQPDTAKRKR